LRDLLLRLDEDGLVRVRWSEMILDECFGAILANRKDLSSSALERTRGLMTTHFPGAMVRQFEGLAVEIALPDDGDRHVVAAAVRAGVRLIVTFNMRDFPPGPLASSGIAAQHPDDFLLSVLASNEDRFCRVVREQAVACRDPPFTVMELLDNLERGGLVQTVRRLRQIMRPLGWI